MNIKNIAVFGAGTMGHGIAQTAALAGFSVCLCDPAPGMLERGRGLIEQSLQLMTEIGRLTKDRAEAVWPLLSFEAETEKAARGADFIFEAVFEDIKVKQDLFRSLSEWTGQEVILASNTSSFDISLLAEVSRHPQRVVGAHWFHPAQITPAIEVIPTERTSPETLATVLELAEKMGKYATRCANHPGFVANRIQFAMMAEALAIVEEGLASPEEVDRIVKSSFGFRLSRFGPFEIADQAGMDVYKSIFASLFQALGREQFRPPKLLDKMVEEKRLGLKSGRGFYEYGQDGAAALYDRRDRSLSERLKLFEKENMGK
ncbi:MAG: 3-hydroxyacyl-CoA dehydrogenase family protein [Deltaproteobacteria bacterium]|nr:3-hydroxyacyl-CoA dehydrogenase family protein [Deltaproteobacteria bacterium]